MTKYMSKDNLKISVIIFNYNFGPYIAECIESILAQTLQPDEILICDDCSSDNSWNIIQLYAQQYPKRICAYRHRENIGHVKNGIFGRKQVKNKLFSSIDGDDRWHHRKLELELKALCDNPKAKIAYSNVIEIDENGNYQNVWHNSNHPPLPEGDVFIPVFAKRFFPVNRAIFRNPLVYRDAIEIAGIADEDIPIHIDWDQKIRLTALFPVVYSGEALIEYRQHLGGLSKMSGKKNIESIRAVYKKNKHLLLGRSPKECEYVNKNISELISDLEQKFGVSKRQQNRVSIHNHNRVKEPHLPRLLVNSLPKSGTHLIKKVVQMLGIAPTTTHISKNLVIGNEGTVDKKHLLPAGVDWSEPITDHIVVQMLKSVPQGYFSTAHMPYSPLFGAILDQMGVKSILILRDPRDVVLSMANYVIQDPDHFLFDLYRKMTEEERIKISISGFEAKGRGKPGLYDIGTRWRRVLPWLAQPYNYTTYFEKLVGPQGGGNAQVQMQEIENIASHLTIEKTRKEIATIADQVFGGTKTFRKGKIAAWREKFTLEHKQLFKNYAGDILIKWGYEQDENW